MTYRQLKLTMIYKQLKLKWSAPKCDLIFKPEVGSATIEGSNPPRHN